MTGFELRTSGIRSDRSTNWATTTAPNPVFVEQDFEFLSMANKKLWRPNFQHHLLLFLFLELHRRRQELK